MPKKTFGVRLMLLVMVGGVAVWQSAGFYASDVDAANAGAQAVHSGKAFARRILQA